MEGLSSLAIHWTTELCQSLLHSYKSNAGLQNAQMHLDSSCRFPVELFLALRYYLLDMNRIFIASVTSATLGPGEMFHIRWKNLEKVIRRACFGVREV
jgi:hypothetical protein